mmetsp:Transcript_6311/g.16082  ORF Transcript_6311/g.16082 Transcript_6311/m.16082 type:complete len:244 (-) Transcript_6311:410-1141(-)
MAATGTTMARFTTTSSRQQLLTRSWSQQQSTSAQSTKHVSPDEGFVKRCPTCHRDWVVAEQNRTKCPGCGSSLPTLAELRKRKRIADGVQLEEWARPESRLYTKAPTRVTTTSGGTSVTESVDPPRWSMPEGCSVASCQLPVLPINPNTTPAIQEVMARYHAIVGLRGSVAAGAPVHREWVQWVCDLGASLKEEFHPKVLAIIGQGHEEQCYIRVCSKIGYKLASGYLAPLLGSRSTQQILSS